MHRLLENSARGAIDRNQNLHAAVEAEFRRLLASKESALCSCEDTAHFGSLSQTFTEAEWHNHVQTHLLAAESLLKKAPVYREPSGGAVHAGRSFSDLVRPGAWPEVSIQSESLRLAGRMDYVEILSDETVLIRDHKGGQILDKDGTVHQSIQLQLRLYGLAVLSQRPESRVQLSVSNGNREYVVDFDDSHAEETELWLTEFLSTTPANVEHLSETHATPGRACSLCAHRHVCRAYLRTAPQFWNEGLPGSRQALDTWGVITESTSSNGLTTIDIDAASSRRVRVQRLDTARHQLYDVKMGQQIWLFGLASSRKRIIGGRHVQPRNFFELPSTLSDRRAWSLCVFGDDSQ